MDIQHLITEARDRQIARKNAYRTEQEARADAAAEQLEESFNAAFGAELFTALGAETTFAIDDPARIVFTYQMRDYSLRLNTYDGVRDWRLIRLDLRSDDDDRRLPTTSFNETRRDTQANIDAFVLALYELDETPGTPYPPAHVELRTPTAGETLLEALRHFMQSEAKE